jgi:hypothetical protein
MTYLSRRLRSCGRTENDVSNRDEFEMVLVMKIDRRKLKYRAQTAFAEIQLDIISHETTFQIPLPVKCIVTRMSLVPGQKARFVDPLNLPPSPQYVFRGHVAEITAVEFIRNNSRLVTR